MDIDSSDRHRECGPVPDCDCHECAIDERDRLRARAAVLEAFMPIIADDGDVEFDWGTTKGDMLSVYFTPRGEMGYALLEKGAPESAGKASDVIRGLPVALHRILRAALAQGGEGPT